MTNSRRPKRTGLILVGALAVLTLTGHLLIQASHAVPTLPTGPCGAVGSSGAGDGSPCADAVSGPTVGGTLVGGDLALGGTSFASPAGSSVSFHGKLDRTAVLRGGDGQVKMELVLAAEERQRAGVVRTPTDFVIVLDRSSSMGGDKIEHARAAVRELISQLTASDRFALVCYDSDAEIAIPLDLATSEAREGWRQVVAGITPQGGTNMSSGLDLALGMTGSGFGRAARLILISDGHANAGDATLAGLSARARRFASKEAVVTTVGVGQGFNEMLMSSVADAGTGNYYYVERTEQLAQVFSDEFESSRETVASAVAVTIETGHGVRVVDAAGYPLERRGNQTTFRPGSLFSGQERRIWVTLAVPNDFLGDRALGSFSLTFNDPAVDRQAPQRLSFTNAPMVACVQGETEYHESFDQETWARSVAQEDYNSLQQQVAGYVREGRREEALKEINDFRVYNERLNRVMKNQEVVRKLEDLTTLQTEVEEAFEGANQAHKQNLLSKTKQYAGRDGRRVGSKKVAKPQPSNPDKGGA